MSDSAERKAIEASTEYLSDIQSVFIAALAAARADGTVDSSESDLLSQMASSLGQQKALQNAFDYFDSFKTNESAMEGVLKCLEASSDTTKLASLLFMKMVLDLNGMDEAESKFYQTVSDRITQ